MKCLQSEEDISKYDNFSIWDLKIKNEKDDLICDTGNILNNQYQKHIGEKLIEKTNHNMKLLVYMYTDSFPVSRPLNINLLQVALYNRNIKEERNVIYTDINFAIDLIDKFVNREYTLYNSDSETINKAIVSKTGFCAIIENSDLERIDAKLIDEEGITYKCFYIPILNYNGNNNYGIIISNYNNTEREKIKLVIKNIVLELKKIS